MQFYVNGQVCEAFDESGECMLRRLYEPDTDTDLPDVLEYKKAWFKRRLAAIRYDHEVAGVPVSGGHTLATDRQSQALLTGAVVMAPDTPTLWKMASGAFVEATPRYLGTLVATHVQNCFANEARIVAEIENAATLEDLEAIDLERGWNFFDFK